MSSLFQQILVCLVLLNPIKQDGRPAWLDNPEKQYPNSDYITAVGSGDTRKDAENSAAANLSKIFEARIKSVETINARYVELMKSPNQSSLESETNINKNTSVSSEQTLYNIRYAESYTDQEGRVYVLAVIERQPTAEIYGEKYEQNDSRIAHYVEQSTRTGDPVMKYAYLNAAFVFSNVNQTLSQQLLIIDPGRTISPKSGYTLDSVAELSSAARESLPFSIAMTGEEHEKVTDMVRGTLSTLGFEISDKGVLNVQGTSDIRKIDMNSDQKFVRWSYSIAILDSHQNVVISLSENGREGHLNYEEAAARALRTMKEKIDVNMTKQLNHYFDSLVMK